MRATLHPKLVAGCVARGYGMGGQFDIQGPVGHRLHIVSSDSSDPMAHLAGGWEHVSVSLPNRCPNWTEMCFVKNLFWGPEEIVMQFHPPESQNISNHPYCLHMWRNPNVGQALPPAILVGIKELGELPR